MNPLPAALEKLGPASADTLARHLGVSTITISRYVKSAGAAVVTLGRGQHTLYALPLFAYSERAQWPLFWVSEAGEVSEFATATLLKPGALHLYRAPLSLLNASDLGWPLFPLHLRGYLGRAQRARLGAVAQAWDGQPERWSVAQRVFAAQSSALDHAGAVLFGEGALSAWQEACARSPQVEADYDSLAAEASAGRIAGSSADGEQPKFSTRVADAHGEVRDVLVKFSPPRGTSFGERWNDLLRAEAHAAAVLAAVGFAVPHTRIVGGARTYLESARIDRVGRYGRRHLLPLAAVHGAFVPGNPQSWPATVKSLVLQKRLPLDALLTTQTLYAFGQLIGNTDMHFGNLGVIAASPEQLAQGKFSLAPVYDMLPMRFAPSPHSDGHFGYTAFTPELSLALPEAVRTQAHALARHFWLRCANDAHSSVAWRAFAAERA